MFRQIMIVYLCGVAMVAAYAGQMQLAGIRVGMSPKQVEGMLGKPQGVLYTKPPLILDETTRSAPEGSLPPIYDALPAIVLFRNNDRGGMAYEVDTGIAPVWVAPATASQVTNSGPRRPGGLGGPSPTTGAGPTRPGGLGGSSGSPPAGGVTNTQVTVPTVTTRPGGLPAWAYPVRVSSLSLDQQEYIYRINSTYSVGILFTGEGAEMRVTDVIIGSFEPFMQVPGTPAVPPTARKVNFYFPARKMEWGAATLKGVTLGSTFAQVLKKHGWPPIFLPFVTQAAGTVSLTTGTPAYPTLNNVPDPGVEPTTAGNDAVSFYNTNSRVTTSAGFTRNFEMIYPEDGVALTVIDMVVVRVRVGSGVVKPTDIPTGNGGAFTATPTGNRPPVTTSPAPPPTGGGPARPAGATPTAPARPGGGTGPRRPGGL